MCNIFPFSFAYVTFVLDCCSETWFIHHFSATPNDTWLLFVALSILNNSVYSHRCTGKHPEQDGSMKTYFLLLCRMVSACPAPLGV